MRMQLLGRWRLACRRAAEDGGAAAVEFAMFAPILAFALLATVDLGMALSQRISMDHVLRSGAQFAMEDPGEDETQAILEDTAARNFQVAAAESDDTFSMGGDPLALSVDRVCACPDSPETFVACSTVCPGTVPTFIYYRMSAAKDYSGILLRGLPLNASAQVQVR